MLYIASFSRYSNVLVWCFACDTSSLFKKISFAIVCADEWKVQKNIHMKDIEIFKSIQLLKKVMEDQQAKVFVTSIIFLGSGPMRKKL